ncbi:ATP-binding protein [Alkalinema pantanalense CENA528]|uniref:nSTAND1 domain-containing NTPase n=1 Tax=Alkalinema pantanalense TaxID=1620705 RepID=UPI003D6FF313
MALNLFTVGKPVPADRFIGRTAEIATAFDQITSQSNLAVWGSPGIGKSSFLNLLADPQAWQIRGYDPTSAVIVRFSCLELLPFSEPRFWKEILTQIQDYAETAEIVSEAKTVLQADNLTKDGLRQVLREIGRQGQYLVLLVDDYDATLQPQPGYDDNAIATFVSDCRNLCSHARESQYLSMVVTSLRRLNELGPKLQPGSSPWYNHYLFLPIKPFSTHDVAALMGGLPMTPALRDGIREMTNGHPALLQSAGNLLYRELRSGNVPDPQAFAADFRTMTQHLYEAFWNLASDVEQTLMMLIALLHLKGRLQKKRYDLGDLELVFSQKERELSNLVEQGILTRKSRAGEFKYAFASSMMEWWVVEEMENSSEDWLRDRQRVFLNLMSHRQAETVTNAIRWLWQHKDELPTILEWLAKISTAFPKGMIPG